jgi:hypothetical protein
VSLQASFETCRKRRRYTATVMIRRMVPLVMAMALALGPVALDVCQAICAEHDHGDVATSASTGDHHHSLSTEVTMAHHHGHHTAASATVAGVEMRGIPSACAHGAELPAFVGTNLQAAGAPALASTRFEFPAPTSQVAIRVTADLLRPPPAIALTTQLRV